MRRSHISTEAGHNYSGGGSPNPAGNPVYLVGVAASTPISGIANANPASRILWGGASGGMMCKILRANGGGIRDLQFDGNALAATGIRLESSQFQNWDTVAVSNTVAGGSTDSAVVMHGGTSPDQATVSQCAFRNLFLGSVAKGLLLTSNNSGTDVAECVFSGTYVKYTGSWAVRIEASDACIFIGLFLIRDSGTGDALQLQNTSGSLFGTQSEYFFQLKGSGNSGGGGVVVNTSKPNYCFGYNMDDGLPAPSGTYPQNLIIGGAYGGYSVTQSPIFEIVDPSSSYVADIKKDPDAGPSSNVVLKIPMNADGLIQVQRVPFIGNATGTVTPDVSKYDYVVYTLTGSVTIATPTHPTTGQWFVLTIIQDSTGGWSVTWDPTNHKFVHSWSDAGNTLNKRSTISFRYDGTKWNQVGAQTPYAALAGC